jgi:hypothetical protein
MPRRITLAVVIAREETRAKLRRKHAQRLSILLRGRERLVRRKWALPDHHDRLARLTARIRACRQDMR